MFRLLLLPAILLILVTGCSMQGELEYAQSQNAASAEETKDDGSQRQMQQEETAAGLRMKWASSAGSERTAAPTPTEENPQSSTVIFVEPKPQAIQTGDINVHIGDIHHHEHTHVYVDQSITVATLAADVVVERNAAPTEPEQARVTPLDERCERLQREHEARVGDWARLFGGD